MTDIEPSYKIANRYLLYWFKKNILREYVCGLVYDTISAHKNWLLGTTHNIVIVYVSVLSQKSFI